MTRIVKNPDERRREIIQAAKTLFQTREYEKTTMSEIMKILNIAKGTIYHYFSSKEELLEAVVQDLVQEDLHKKQELISRPGYKKMNALEKLKTLLTSGNIADGNEEILEHLHTSGNTILHTRQLAYYLNELAPLYARVVQEGCEEGIFKVANPLECSEFILAGLQFLTDTGFYPWSGEQLSRRISAFPSLVEAQLGAQPGSFQFLSEL
ncbi:MAG: TetR/AcrR family transcriptional regulator [Spirochaetales bacterium]|nr:TetR/AcrR family transcriptional regulator [Spirochaetales bacterium]